MVLNMPDGDVVLSTRVRLARNFADMPFPIRQNKEWADEAVKRVSESVMHVFKENYSLIKLADVEPNQSRSMVEKHLISLDLLNKADVAAVLLRSDERVSVMVNEEDHVRIQSFFPGLNISEGAKEAGIIDDVIDEESAFAYDRTWGYLTACPTNTGTGLRVSVMLHLPAMAMTGQIGHAVAAVGKMGMTVRGLYGEGSEALGNLFQLSNQVTLGRNEAEIYQSLESVAGQIIERERQTRHLLGQRNKTDIEDRLMRSLGAMLYARKLSSKEFMGLWSDVWLLAALEWVDIDREELTKLIVRVQPATLEIECQKPMEEEQRDVRRAEVVRETLDDAIAKG